MNTETESRSSRRADAVANRARVLEAARQVFAEQGLAAEVKDIAERAGVGVATLYRGFGSKDELLVATIEQADLAIADLLLKAENTVRPGDAVRVLIEGLLGYARSYGWLIQALLAGNGIERPEASQQRRDQNRARMLSLVRRALADAPRPIATTPEVVKLLIEGAVFAIAIRSQRREEHPEPLAVADALVRLLTCDSQAQPT